MFLTGNRCDACTSPTLGRALWDILPNPFGCDPGSADMLVSEIEQLIELS
jgi:hypothetical protein